MEQAGFDTQEALHQACGVSQAHIGNILRMEQAPGLLVIARLAKTFGLQTWQMMAPAELMREGLPPELFAVITDYLSSDSTGRKIISGVARNHVIAQHKSSTPTLTSV